MSVFAAGGHAAPRRPSWSVRALRVPQPPGARASTPALLVRLAAVIAVGTYALVRFLALVVAPPRGAGVVEVLAAASAGLLAIAASRVRRRGARWSLLAVTVVVAAAASLLAAGAPVRLLAPRHWSELVSALGSGFGALPGLNVPYAGVSPWARVALVLSGGALLALAALAATWPRASGRGAGGVAVLALAILFAIPAIELTGAHPWRSGAAFALGIGAVLEAERLGRRRAPAALAAFAVAILAAMWLAPGLDRATPIVDVQALASRLQPTASVAFSWNHRYGPLNWPRDGREVLRVQARVEAYWKAVTLDDFDGRVWRAGPPPTVAQQQADRDLADRHPGWIERLTVAVSALRTHEFLGAGTVLGVDHAPRLPIPGTTGTYVSATTPLTRGDAYQATAYVPRPSAGQLEVAGTSYPATVTFDDLVVDLRRVLPGALGGVGQRVVFSPWGTGGPPAVYAPQSGGVETGARGALARSAYASTYALSRRLAAQASTPYDYVRAVLRYFETGGFTYDESPPARRNPLAAFLFRDKRGYCQQFSGAMALLLRMGGVPARVAAGFSPGTFDSSSGEYVVRDTDAHSWVEAYFPKLGWVTFDPTPSIAPARSQVQAAPVSSGSPGVKALAGAPKTQGHARADVGVVAHATPVWRRPLALAGAAVLALALAMAAWVAASAPGRRDRTTGGDATLAELERALRRARRSPMAATTLVDLERTLGGSEDAKGYFRAVRHARFGGGAAAPTAAQRRALRRALGEGLGTTGRIRALWALPPRGPSRLGRPAPSRRRVH